ncbi:MAG: alpha/beta hydrolase [Paraglaciecola sp.]|nr:alpha/beta hydrolase [Paraglaciecola sp.]NCT46888.1 alpha/beta hydrolase [Paraglaciecola sp.]
MPTISFNHYQRDAQYLQVGNYQLAYWHWQHATARDTIVFIHGFPSASWDWHHQWQVLAKEYNLVAMDMLGFGLSAKPLRHDYSLAEQADLLSQLLSHLAIKNYHILAHDYGDSVAQELLYRQVEVNQPAINQGIRSICFLNGGLFAKVHRPILMQKMMKGPLGPVLAKFMSKASLSKNFTQIFGRQTPPKPADLNAIWQLITHNNGKRIIPKLLSYLAERRHRCPAWIAVMQKTTVPLYFINGTQDPISGQHMLDHYRQIIPHPRTSALDVGHYPQLEAPYEVTRLYQQFLLSLKA